MRPVLGILAFAGWLGGPNNIGRMEIGRDANGELRESKREREEKRKEHTGTKMTMTRDTKAVDRRGVGSGVAGERWQKW